MTTGITQATGLTAVSVTESSTGPAVGNAGTIATNTTSSRVAPGAAVTGVILQNGVVPGQECTVINQSIAGNTITFDVSGTSHVADGASSVIAGLTARKFIWDSATSLWYACK